jgi:hypothetical protein
MVFGIGPLRVWNATLDQLRINRNWRLTRGQDGIGVWDRPLGGVVDQEHGRRARCFRM